MTSVTSDTTGGQLGARATGKRLPPLYVTACFQGSVFWYATGKLCIRTAGFNDELIAAAMRLLLVFGQLPYIGLLLSVSLYEPSWALLDAGVAP